VLYSKTAQYSIQAMLFIAANHTKDNCPVCDIAKELKLPASFLSKILQTMSRFGFLNSVKGPRGGFSISEKGAGASIAQIVEIIDGPMDFDMCIAGFTPCDEQHACPMHASWKRIREEIRDLVTKRPLMKLAQDMPAKYKSILLKQQAADDKAKAPAAKKAAGKTDAKKKK
jgi:Rrf2 family protein